MRRQNILHEKSQPVEYTHLDRRLIVEWIVRVRGHGNLPHFAGPRGFLKKPSTLQSLSQPNGKRGIRFQRFLLVVGQHVPVVVRLGLG